MLAFLLLIIGVIAEATRTQSPAEAGAECGGEEIDMSSYNISLGESTRKELRCSHVSCKIEPPESGRRN